MLTKKMIVASTFTLTFHGRALKTYMRRRICCAISRNLHEVQNMLCYQQKLTRDAEYAVLSAETYMRRRICCAISRNLHEVQDML